VAQTIDQLSFELSASALSEQERELTGLRARAGTVLASGSVARASHRSATAQSRSGLPLRTGGTWIDRHLQINRDKRAGLAAWLTLSCALLAFEIVSWILSLVG
jgi:hypothetical protein